MESIVTLSGLILGKEMAVQTISSTSSSILSKIQSISENYDKEFKELFNRLDIKFKLEVITKYIEKKETIVNSTEELCINYIKDIMLLLHQEIKSLEEELVEYNKKWIANITTSNFKTKLQNINNHTDILDKRFDMLIKIEN